MDSSEHFTQGTSTNGGSLFPQTRLRCAEPPHSVRDTYVQQRHSLFWFIFVFPPPYKRTKMGNLHHSAESHAGYCILVGYSKMTAPAVPSLLHSFWLDRENIIHPAYKSFYQSNRREHSSEFTWLSTEHHLKHNDLRGYTNK